MPDAECCSFLWTGIFLGMQGGLSPGPISTLIVKESLLHGRRAGMKIALVPLLTDLPIVALVIPLLYFLTSGAESLVGMFSMIGAMILCYLGYESLTVTQRQYEEGKVPKVSLAKAIAANFFNPNLYIYWFGLCGPICVSALKNGIGTMFLFLVAFYTSITLTKITIALAVGNVRHSINLTMIIWINRFLGLAMFVFAVLFFLQGYRLFSGEKTLAAVLDQNAYFRI